MGPMHCQEAEVEAIVMPNLVISWCIVSTRWEHGGITYLTMLDVFLLHGQAPRLHTFIHFSVPGVMLEEGFVSLCAVPIGC
jgi:hypothetical protein